MIIVSVVLSCFIVLGSYHLIYYLHKKNLTKTIKKETQKMVKTGELTQEEADNIMWLFDKYNKL